MSLAINDNARVAIVGAGAAGLMAGVLLRLRGVEFDMFDDGDGPCRLPQAHVVNTRTSEILREVGVFEEMRTLATPIEKTKSIEWAESLAGRRFGKLDLVKDEEALQARIAASAVHPLNLGQNRFEEVVARRLEALGGRVSYGHSIVRAAIEEGGAVLSISNTDGMVSERRYDYVLACDGARSIVRSSLGIDMIGPPSLARYASAYFTADLSDLEPRVGGQVTFIGGADVRGVIIGFDIQTTWALMCVIPPDLTADDFGPDVMLELIHRAIGDRTVAVQLDGVGSWNMSAQIAETFRSGPFFLVGDAAHRFPPTGGLGLNTGVQDAHNLAWKLALVLEGRAHPAILDSYANERMPVAKANCDHSVTNAMRMAEVDAILGVPFLAPVEPTVVQRPEGSLPHLGIDGDDDAADDKRAVLADTIEQQRPHFDSLMHELGYIYDASEIYAVGAHDFRPSVTVGGRLPHALIEVDGSSVGVHDLFASRDAFLLAGKDVDLVKLPPLPGVGVHRFAAENGIVAPEGLVLVRPDGHVSWVGDQQRIEALPSALARLFHTDIRNAA